MKREFVIAFVLGIALACCGQKPAQNDKEAFDITKYLDQISQNEELRFGISSEDLEPKEYALVDIDGDGKNELMVRDTEIHYQAVYTIEGDKLWMLAYADGATDLKFFKNAVGYSAYYSPGRSCNGACMLKNSRHGDCYDSEVLFDISDNETVEDEMYSINGESATAEDVEAFEKNLGETVDAPAAEWLPINRRNT